MLVVTKISCHLYEEVQEANEKPINKDWDRDSVIVSTTTHVNNERGASLQCLLVEQPIIYKFKLTIAVIAYLTDDNDTCDIRHAKLDGQVNEYRVKSHNTEVLEAIISRYEDILANFPLNQLLYVCFSWTLSANLFMS